MKKILTATLAFALFAGAAQAQVKSDSARHHQKGGHEMMGKQLNLTADQKAQMKSIHEAERKDMEALKSNTSLSKEQQRAQRMELHKKYSDQMQALLTPDQKVQMEKMKTEGMGRGKMGKGDFKQGRKPGMKGEGMERRQNMENELNLTQDQKDRMAKARENARTQMESIRNDKTLSEDQKKEKMMSLRKQQQEELKKILTREQLEKMKSQKKDRGAKTTK